MLKGLPNAAIAIMVAEKSLAELPAVCQQLRLARHQVERCAREPHEPDADTIFTRQRRVKEWAKLIGHDRAFAAMDFALTQLRVMLDHAEREKDRRAARAAILTVDAVKLSIVPVKAPLAA